MSALPLFAAGQPLLAALPLFEPGQPLLAWARTLRAPLLALCLIAPVAPAQQAVVDPRPPNFVERVDVMDEIERSLADLGYVLDTSAVPVVGLDHDDWLAVLRDQYESGLSAKEWRLLACFAAAEEGDPGSLTSEELIDQVVEMGQATFMLVYDVRLGRIVHRRGMQLSEPARMRLLTHELVHAHQDQRSDLAEMALVPTTLDEMTVFSCLREGEAEAVSIAADHGWDLALQRLLPLRSKYSAPYWSGGTTLQYGVGAYFAATLYDQGGPERLRDLLRDHPSSTEQVIHPHKLGLDLPSEVAAPALDLDLEPDESTVAGEATLLRMLAGHGVAQHTARQVASGWDGDRIWMYEGGDVVIWRILWDRPEDALHFEDELAWRLPGEVLVVGRRSDWVMAPVPALVTSLVALLEDDPWSPPPSPEDARSTYAQEAWRQRDHEPGEATWPLLDSGLVMDVPAGWAPPYEGSALLQDGTSRALFRPFLEVERVPRGGSADLATWLGWEVERRLSGVELLPSPGGDAAGPARLDVRIDAARVLLDADLAGSQTLRDTSHVRGAARRIERAGLDDGSMRMVWLALPDGPDQALLIRVWAAAIQWDELREDLDAALASIRPAG